MKSYDNIFQMIEKPAGSRQDRGTVHMVAWADVQGQNRWNLPAEPLRRGRNPVIRFIYSYVSGGAIDERR